MAGAPVVFLGVLELALRLVGYGHPTSFLLPSSSNGTPTFIQNDKFAWRFFGPELARRPYPFSVPRTKSPDTVRILILGESAAKGDPDPRFGLPRLLEATLSLRHPGVRFEVVNAAMTAINSHAILPIARDCAALECDVWVVYMGNNEVVGPFGAGTVFGAQALPLPLIRVSLVLQATRTGQLIESLTHPGRPAAAGKSEWGGMEMFLDQQVSAGDPRLLSVYRHFEQNLRDLIRAGCRSGAGVVVSTVSVNLKDCPPFASVHRPGLSAAETARWQELFERGILAQESNQVSAAAREFAEAAKMDDTFAELRYRQGQCALALRNELEAAEHFRAARDRDTLRFRCDVMLNDITRKVASNREFQGVHLADAEAAFAERSAGRLPGEEWFREHVHLTFEGNHLVARVVAEKVEQLLAERRAVRAQPGLTWPTPDDCAQRLGWSDYWRLAGWNAILPRLQRPPFTRQFDHSRRIQRVRRELATTSTVAFRNEITNALRVCEAALVAAPNDWALHSELASLRKVAGDLPGAAVAARRALEILPNDAEGWTQLGMILARQRQFKEAASALRRALELDAQDAGTREGLAQVLGALGNPDEALKEFRRVLADYPERGVLWLHLGQYLETLNRETEAEEAFCQALHKPGRNLQSIIEIAGFCQSRGWLEAAATNYTAAAGLDPWDAQLQVGAAQNLAAIGRLTEARQHSAEAVQTAPDFAEARLCHGLILGQCGEVEAATAQFRAALELNPKLLEARVNLGVALMSRNPAEARQQFQTVLQANPSNNAARQHLMELDRQLESNGHAINK